MSDRVATIAIDGPAASGKGTLARALAERFGLRYLDTGSLYRAVGACVLDAGGDPDDAEAAERCARALDPERLGTARLRDESAAQAASRVAVHPGVRAALLSFQRGFALNPPGAVLDGRDVGTAVLPDATLKFFVVADAEARADRRFAELSRGGASVERATILNEIKSRDARDAGRASAPMKAAADAIVIDTSNLNAAEVLALAVDLTLQRLPWLA